MRHATFIPDNSASTSFQIYGIYLLQVSTFLPTFWKGFVTIPFTALVVLGEHNSDHTIGWQNPGWQISSNICLHVTMLIDMNERLVGYNDIFLYLSASVLIRARRSKRLPVIFKIGSESETPQSGILDNFNQQNPQIPQTLSHSFPFGQHPKIHRNILRVQISPPAHIGTQNQKIKAQGTDFCHLLGLG